MADKAYKIAICGTSLQQN